MKKIKTTLVLLSLMCAATAFGQLKVDSNGRAIFGDGRTYTNGISITDAGTSATDVAFRINRGIDDNVYIQRGTINSMMVSTNGMVTIGYGSMAPAPAINTTYPLEVRSNLSGGVNLSLIGASLSGYRAHVMSTSAYPLMVDYGFIGQSIFTRTFYVKGDGSVWSSAFGSLSDASLKSNIEKIENPLDKVLALQGVTYDFNFVKPSEEEEKMSLEEAFKKEQAATPGITMETFKQIQEEKKRKHIGVIAQDVEKVLPEVVRTREDGLKTVMYSDITGLLIEAIKEQQTQIEELRKEIDALTGGDKYYAPAATTNISGASDELLSQCVLYQNVPNPFNVRTEIRYELPAQVKQAEIYIFNMQGTLLKRIDAGRAGYVTINGSELTPGLYLYSLVADGVAIDTKRMILTD